MGLYQPLANLLILLQMYWTRLQDLGDDDLSLRKFFVLCLRAKVSCQYRSSTTGHHDCNQSRWNARLKFEVLAIGHLYKSRRWSEETRSTSYCSTSTTTFVCARSRWKIHHAMTVSQEKLRHDRITNFVILFSFMTYWGYLFGFITLNLLITQ